MKHLHIIKQRAATAALKRAKERVAELQRVTDRPTSPGQVQAYHMAELVRSRLLALALAELQWAERRAGAGHGR